MRHKHPPIHSSSPETKRHIRRPWDSSCSSETHSDCPCPSTSRLDCCRFPMWNTAWVAFVKTTLIVNDKVGVPNGCFIGIVLEGATIGSTRHDGDTLAHNHVYERAFSCARLAEKDDVMHGTLNRSDGNL